MLANPLVLATLVLALIAGAVVFPSQRRFLLTVTVVVVGLGALFLIALGVFTAMGGMHF